MLHSPVKVWRALTDPNLIPRWASTGKGARHVGFSTVVGTRFQFCAKPMPGWNGIVDCEMIEAREPSLLRFTWRGWGNGNLTTVTCRLEAYRGGTRLTWEHTGFRGIGGFIVCKLLASVRRKMLTEGFPPVLADLDDIGKDSEIRQDVTEGCRCSTSMVGPPWQYAYGVADADKK